MKTKKTLYATGLIARLFKEIEELKIEDFSKHKEIIKSDLIFIKQLQS